MVLLRPADQEPDRRHNQSGTRRPSSLDTRPILASPIDADEEDFDPNNPVPHNRATGPPRATRARPDGPVERPVIARNGGSRLSELLELAAASGRRAQARGCVRRAVLYQDVAHLSGGHGSSE